MINIFFNTISINMNCRVHFEKFFWISISWRMMKRGEVKSKGNGKNFKAWFCRLSSGFFLKIFLIGICHIFLDMTSVSILENSSFPERRSNKFWHWQLNKPERKPHTQICTESHRPAFLLFLAINYQRCKFLALFGSFFFFQTAHFFMSNFTKLNLIFIKW